MAMSAIPMRPTGVFSSPRDAHVSEKVPSAGPPRPEAQGERIQLPPIRDLVPDFQFQAGPPESTTNNSTRTSSPYGTSRHEPPYTPPENVPSPSSHKRRRITPEDDVHSESRDHVVARLYQNSPGVTHLSAPGGISPVSSTRRESSFSNAESWTSSARTSPYTSSHGLPPMGSPPQMYESGSQNNQEWRPKLPSLPTFPGTAIPQDRRFTEYSIDCPRTGAQTYPQIQPSMFDAPTSPYYVTPGISYGYQQPRGQSYSGPSGYTLAQDRTPFSVNGPYGMHTPGYPSYPMENSHEASDNKQRKRRGNLPKETTDKLRAWFVAHLQHPYPTEDEKQELMRQTGLQMNQISNWFINARRRQLPAMINNARAESSATSGNGGGTRGDGRGGPHGEASSEFDERRNSGSDVSYEEYPLRHKRDSI